MAATVKYFKNPGVIQRAFGHISGSYTAATEVASSSGAGSPASVSNPNGVLGAGSDGASLTGGTLTITPGFVPNYAKVMNVTDRITQEWFKGMNQGDFIETSAAGVRSLETDDKLVVNETTGVVSVLANGTAITDNDVSVWEVQG
jgi:hypothetical protein